MTFYPGMSLADAVGRIAPIADVPADQIEGFIILIVGKTDADNSIAASENISPHMAAHMLEATAGVLFTAERERGRRARGN